MALLEVDPKKRISAEDALEHPFFSESLEKISNEENYTVNALEGKTLNIPLQNFSNLHQEYGGLIIKNNTKNDPENYSPEFKKNFEERNVKSHFNSNFQKNYFENEEGKNNSHF